jgi:DNA replication protein DnaD
MEGWISIYRQIQDNWIWKSKEPFDRRSAWISLLLKANHEDNKIVMGNKIITVKKGSFITSEIKLSKEWKWSRQKVRDFIQLLVSDKMLSKTTTTNYTTLTVENWGLYQIENQQKNNKKTTEKQQKNTNNNIDNINNTNTTTNIAKVDRLMIECLNTTNTNNIMECTEYLDYMSIETIEYVLKKTARKQFPSWNLARAILEDYKRKNITTLEQAQADDYNFKARVQGGSNARNKTNTERKYDENGGLKDRSYLFME